MFRDSWTLINYSSVQKFVLCWNLILKLNNDFWLTKTELESVCKYVEKDFAIDLEVQENFSSTSLNLHVKFISDQKFYSFLLYLDIKEFSKILNISEEAWAR